MDNLKRIPIIISMDVCGSLEFIRLFDGFNTVEKIVNASVYEEEEINDFLESNIKKGDIVWRDAWSPLMWCKKCDMPLLQQRCGICGENADTRIDIKFPCNPRPVMAHDEKMFRAVGFPWPMDYSLMVNAYKVPEHWGWELIHGGKVIGDIIQTHQHNDFSFIARSIFDKGSLAARGVTIRQLAAANADRLDYLEKEAIAFLNSYKQSLRLVIPILGFSGGKDSVVLANITSKSKFARAFVYQVNTGIEPESNDDFSRKFLARYKKFTVKTLFAKDMYWKAIEKLGPQALDFQWCRTILKNMAIQREKREKKLALLELVSRFVKTKILVVHGARNREEPERVPIARTLKLAANHAIMPKATTETIFPLALFTDLDIWLYIHSRNLPVNPTYTDGKSQRQLCKFCFEKNDYEFENDMRDYPEDYSRLETALRKWQKILDFPEEWISRRLWRYNDSSSRYMKNIGITSRVDAVVAELAKTAAFEKETRSNGQAGTKGRLHFPVRLDELSGWFRALGKCSLKNNTLLVKPSYARLIALLGGSTSDTLFMTVTVEGVITIAGSDNRLVRDFSKIVAGWALMFGNCIQCGGCLKHSKKIVLDRDRLFVRNVLNVETIKAAFSDCPVHPDGVRNLTRPLSKEYSPTSCTACFINYQRDMAYIDPANRDTASEYA
jgi:3'-phosphoadenosine 5'-phosphosulfate sulfotransferase (PAPS reductase)/FAD synthetase